MISFPKLKNQHQLKPTKNINITIPPESEKNKKVQKIRFSLINNPKGLITIGKKKYKVVVEKSTNSVNYYLYNPEAYSSFLGYLVYPLSEICKQWNDEEYIRLFIQLNAWKRKEENSEAKKLIQYLSEIKGKFDIWYLEHQIEPPTLVDKILQMREKIVQCASTILTLKSDLNSLNNEKESLEKQFDNDIISIPADLSAKLKQKEYEIESVLITIEELRIKLYGKVNGEEEGLIWKHDRFNK